MYGILLRTCDVVESAFCHTSTLVHITIPDKLTNRLVFQHWLSVIIKITSWSYVPPLTEEATESKGGHFAKLKWFSIVKITFLWRGLKYKKGHGLLAPRFCHLWINIKNWTCHNIIYATVCYIQVNNGLHTYTVVVTMPCHT